MSPSPVPAPTREPWFGPVLDWTTDGATQYAERLGTGPSLYGQAVRYPLSSDDSTYLRQFVEQAAPYGSVAQLTLEPTKPLDDLTGRDARSLARQLERLHQRHGTIFLVRFAPEMNGSWTTWGQQPDAYRAAFRTVAKQVHGLAPHSAMLWTVAYGAGYPFGKAYGAVPGSGPRVAAQLDTSGDGKVDARDDPYGPYYPGADAVDWVGTTMYHFGRRPDFGDGLQARPGEVEARLAETYGYGSDAPSDRVPFYDRFSRDTGAPFAIETGILTIPGSKGGDPELTVKRDWWSQLFDPTIRLTHPNIAAFAWLEKQRPEEEVDGLVVDWRATHTGELADALRTDLARDGLLTGPVTRALDQETANEATTQYRERPGTTDQMGWIVACTVLALGLFMLAGAATRWRPQWRYSPEDDPRDRRLDFLRGWTIVAVVVTHIEVAGPYSYVTLNAIGAITGAEMFVLLSGVVLGMVYPIGVKRLGEWGAAVGALRRARKQYVTALAVVTLVWLIGLLPGVSARVVTTFTDRGTGADGTTSAGQVYDLYGNFPRLFDYPPPWYAVQQFLLLEMGPWVFNIMGLFVVLSLLVPALMWLIRRRMWWIVLGVSWVLYLVEAQTHWHPLPSQFEVVFPLLSWQIAFTHGLVIGYYRRQITAALVTRRGIALVSVLVAGYAGTLALLWAGQHLGFTVPFTDQGTYDWLYPHLYQRTNLQAGRLLDLVLVLVTAYALLTACWLPLNRVFGWFYVPLGTASLYVFIVHVFFVLAVGNVPGLDRMSWWQGTLVHTAVLAAIWLMVTRRFLFKLIPT
ncbi:OpgC domain-containing protein [Aeromicrobium stalagmiti]|uniref:OpgC domain-containing protein n=1 Tax=Aeromicrobium stalagmiti TaxID=2738988 RepID=UPI001568A442|nr:OpgC domain-containing protein [Aeromicrobium stalagmiti]